MSRRDRFTLPLLLLLTLLAGGLRFIALDKPGIWGDEAATYGRVVGSYGELLSQLTDSLFAPLHYESEWWVAHGLPYWGRFDPPAVEGGARTFVPTKFLLAGGADGPGWLSPRALRFIPALAGTLFVPAVFFLARQLFGPRVSLTAAGLACVSAYALVYSRDAKMYMQLWLAVTMHVGCGLWWLRSRRGLAWALWVFFGVCLVGTQAVGYAVLAIDALLVFTTPHAHWRKVLTMAGLGAWPLVIGPAYLLERRRWFKGGWTHLDFDRLRTWPRRATAAFQWPLVVGFAVGAGVMAAAALGPLGYAGFSKKWQSIAADNRNTYSAGEAGIGWVAPYNVGRTLPDYLLYTGSAYLTGWEWPRKVPRLGVDEQQYVPPQRLCAFQAATTGLAVLLAIGVVPWRRLATPARARRDRVRQDGGVYPPFRTRRAFWLAAWAVVFPWAVYVQMTDRPVNVLDGAASLLLDAPPDVDWPRLRLPRAPKDDPVERWRQAVVNTRAAWPAAWTKYAAAWTWPNVSAPAIALTIVATAAAGGLAVARRRGVGYGSLRALGIALTLGGVLTLINVSPRVTQDVWMPRYLGVVLPAVFVVLAVLIDRQPVALRVATIALFVAVNGVQFASRVWGETEPPAALMAADVVASQPKSVVAANPERPTQRTYVDVDCPRTPEPGGGTLRMPAAAYYLRELSRVPGVASDIREGRFDRHLRVSWISPDNRGELDRIVRGLTAARDVARVVVWTGLRLDGDAVSDPLGDRLSGGFVRVEDRVWTCRDHWRWMDRFKVRRRVYERLPATRPAPTTGTTGRR